MNQYKVNVTYTRLNSDNDTVTKIMPFVVTANSLEEARNLVQESAISYIDKVSGSLVSVE
jgi:hypothetical protein